MGVQAILDQFLNHRDQAVADNLARLDLVDLDFFWGGGGQLDLIGCFFLGGGGEVHTDFRSMGLMVVAMASRIDYALFLGW